MSNRQQILVTLRRTVEELESHSHSLGSVVSTGSSDFDQLLGGGFEQGSLVEWINAPGAGATTLALIAAREACQKQGLVVVVDEKGLFYPPAAQSLGLNLDQIIVIRPANRQDYYWGLIQSLRSTGGNTVISWLETTNERMLRRMQLAAEQGGALGFLIRPPSVLQEPSWAKYRFLIQAENSPNRIRRWKIKILGHKPREIQFEMNDETSSLHQACPLPLATPVAAPTPLQGAS
jgi:hypothetical protein